MKISNELLATDIKSGRYYLDGREWYYHKYLFPLFERSVMIFVAIFFGIVILILMLNIYSLYPLNIQRSYVSYFKDGESAAVPQIIKANFQPTELQSVNYLLVKNYVVHRESYDYDQLKSQLIYIKNNSTKLIFNDFYETLLLTNPNSIILKFEKNAVRTVNILNISFIDDNKVEVNFKAKATDNNNQILEDTTWKVTLIFESSTIDVNAVPNTRFNFIVTGYNIKQLKSS